jgi:hypothetical protein
MRKLFTFLILAAVVALGVLVSRGPAAPALADKPVKWEYAELLYSRGAPAMNPGMAAQRLVGPGGVAPVAPPAAAPTTVWWFTADEEIEATDWKALADKLRAPAAKNDGSQTMHRLRVLNRLSADGWEIYEHTGTTNWTFRRRVQ